MIIASMTLTRGSGTLNGNFEKEPKKELKKEQRYKTLKTRTLETAVTQLKKQLTFATRAARQVSLGTA